VNRSLDHSPRGVRLDLGPELQRAGLLELALGAPDPNPYDKATTRRQAP